MLGVTVISGVIRAASDNNITTANFGYQPMNIVRKKIINIHFYDFGYSKIINVERIFFFNEGFK